MNKIVKDALILFAITLVAGVLLGFVYDITKDPIAAQNEKAKQEAYKEVMADADSFEALSGDAYSEANITATFEIGKTVADAHAEAGSAGVHCVCTGGAADHWHHPCPDPPWQGTGCLFGAAGHRAACG